MSGGSEADAADGTLASKESAAAAPLKTGSRALRDRVRSVGTGSAYYAAPFERASAVNKSPNYAEADESVRMSGGGGEEEARASAAEATAAAPRTESMGSSADAQITGSRDQQSIRSVPGSAYVASPLERASAVNASPNYAEGEEAVRMSGGGVPAEGAGEVAPDQGGDQGVSETPLGKKLSGLQMRPSLNAGRRGSGVKQDGEGSVTGGAGIAGEGDAVDGKDVIIGAGGLPVIEDPFKPH